MPLEHQQDDETTLQQKHGADRQDRPAVGFPWRSGLKRTVLPGGRSLSLIPKRCICRQSYFGDAYRVGGVLMSPGFSPFRIRTATAAATALPSSTECMGPPTVVVSPKKLSMNEKTGALAMAESLLNAVLASWAAPAASTFI